MLSRSDPLKREQLRQNFFTPPFGVHTASGSKSKPTPFKRLLLVIVPGSQQPFYVRQETSKCVRGERMTVQMLLESSPVLHPPGRGSKVAPDIGRHTFRLSQNDNFLYGGYSGADRGHVQPFAQEKVPRTRQSEFQIVGGCARFLEHRLVKIRFQFCGQVGQVGSGFLRIARVC